MKIDEKFSKKTGFDQRSGANPKLLVEGLFPEKTPFVNSVHRASPLYLYICACLI